MSAININSGGKKPFLADVYPDKAQYYNGQVVNIIVEVTNPSDVEFTATVNLEIFRLETTIMHDIKEFVLAPFEERTVCFTYSPPQAEWSGYGADADLYVNNCLMGSLSTAFDVVSSWGKAIRYGFLCDFYEKDEKDAADVEQMSKLHLNAVQFYDWMYKHEKMLPETEVFIDPLDRTLSMRTIKSKLELCHRYGMKALAYGAIYGAGDDFYKLHRDWAYYDNNGKVIRLGDWLAIMNISPGSPWVEHIMDEFSGVVADLGFDGIHMDTYGFPKEACSRLDTEGKIERLDDHFPLMINSVKERLGQVREDPGIIFNAVGNWGTDKVASAAQDAVYIEVWDPCDKYRHLHQIISKAKEKGNKPVILAAYLTPFENTEAEAQKQAQTSFLLTSATIFASGGYHIILGEYNGLLTNGYYVNYATVDSEFVRIIRNYYDFIVRYANVLYDLSLEEVTMTHTGGINTEFVFSNSFFSNEGEPGKVWTIIKKNAEFVTINLINLTGIQSDRWNEAKEQRPVPVKGICAEALIFGEIEGVYVATPDVGDAKCKKLDFEYIQREGGRYIRFQIPELDIWETIFIRRNQTGSFCPNIG